VGEGGALARTPARYARPVDPKTRNRIMAVVLVVMFIVVALAAALNQ
jgi:hypothetical protein